MVRADLCHPIIATAMKPVHEKIPHFNLTIFLSKGKISYPDITPTDSPVYPRMVMLGKCFTGYNSKHEKVTDSHARRVHEKLKGAIRYTLGK